MLSKPPTENADTTTSLATLEGYVTQAEQHGGGYVQIVIHHLCSTGTCDDAPPSVSIEKRISSPSTWPM